MIALVAGGSGSGKSRYAEELAARLAPSRTYLATMAAAGVEAQARIARHRAQRAGQGFVTIDCSGSIPFKQVAPYSQGVVLLDDVGNLVAQALFTPDGSMANPSQVIRRLSSELDQLADFAGHLVVVGNEAGGAGPYPAPGTHAWIEVCGTLCCQLAARADSVVEVVAGIPCPVKGELP